MYQSNCQSRDELLGQAANEYFEALARGEAPSVEDYAHRYPDIADDVRRVFPALALVGESTAGVASPMLLPEGGGRQQLGDFRIEREIGRGGMGIVYEAEQLSLGRRVALKVLPFAAVMDEKAILRFKNEARAAATLEHPNIVPVFAVGNERGVYFYAMAFIEGRTLAEVIQQLRSARNPAEGKSSRAAEQQSDGYRSSALPLSRSSSHSAFRTPHSALDTVAALSTLPDFSSREYYRSVATLGIQAAEALHHAHERGIIHRDIKPGNLMVDLTGKLWITDFGLARIEADAGMTMTGDLLGTIRYMAPEQALGEQGVVDHRADVYSLGVTLYELLALRPAFDGVDRKALLKQIAFEELKPLGKINPAIPPDLQTIISKAISKEPADRYTSAQGFANDLKRFLQHKPIEARPLGPLGQLAKWGRRHSGIVMMACAALVALSAILGISTLLVNRARSDATAALTLSQEQQSRLANLLYAADIRLADQALRNDDIGRALELLDAHVPAAGQEDLRDLEWYFLRARCTAEHDVLANGSEPIYSFTLSPNGAELATVGKESVLRLYDWPSGGLSAEINTQQIEANGVAFSNDSQSIYTTGDDGTIQARTHSDLQIARMIATSSKKVFDVLYLKSSGLLATCGHDQVICLWDPRSGDIVRNLEGHQDTVTSIAVSPQEDKIASISRDGTVCVWRLDGGGQLWKRDLGERPSAMAFAPDGSYLVVGNTSGRIHRFRLDDGAEIERVGVDHVSAVDVSADGQHLVAGDQRGILWLWKFVEVEGSAEKAMQRTRSWKGHEGPVTKVKFLSEGQDLISAGDDGQLKRWRLREDSVHRRIIQLPGQLIHQVAPLADSPHVAIVTGESSRERIAVVDVRTAEVTRYVGHKGTDWRIETSSDGQFISGIDDADGNVYVWSLQSPTRAPARKFNARPNIGYNCFSPSNNRLAVYGSESDNGICLIDLKTGEQENGFVRGGCWAVSFSPDGQLMAAVEKDSNDILVWNIVTNKLVRRFSDLPDVTTQLEFSQDAQILAALGNDHQLHLWDIASGQERWTASFPFTDAARPKAVCLEFSHHGRSLVAGTRSGVIQMWQVETGRELIKLDDLQLGDTEGAAFCDDRRYLCVLKNGELHILETGLSYTIPYGRRDPPPSTRAITTASAPH